ncbi:MAG: glycosyltransferase family 4 protein [bacterium]|nr:glycosyltransferase family 4 protein [bacterium]
MTRRYRILHLITRLELGGAQQNTLYCTTHHDRARFDVELIAGEGGALDAEAGRIPDAHVELVSYLQHSISPLADLRALFALRRHLLEHEIDLIHTHSSKAGILGRLAALLAGVPVVVHTVHGWSFNATQPAPLRGLYLALEKLTARCTDRLIAVSEENRDRGIRLGIGRPESYRVIRSGIDVQRFRRPSAPRESVREGLGFGPEDTVVGTVANFKPQKGPLDFVRVAAAAHEQDPSLRFFYAGDGPLRDQAEAAIAEAGLQDVVRLLGWRRDVVDLYHAMDVFLLTSLFEGLPRAVLQAMAAGVPVVATRTDGTPEVVCHRETGLLAEPGRPDEIAEALLEFTRDPELRGRCAANATRRLGREFDIDGMVRDLDRLYEDLLE